ncbi:MAG: OmpA family protein [Granulosicoccus sp.]|nr:OmpA family protein [Granulosicoccus sp.]
MKSLIAVLALASALGVGYWKMQNPDGGIDEAKSQAHGLMNRLGGGIEAVRSGHTPASSAADANAELESQIVELKQTLRSNQSLLDERLAAVETDAQALRDALAADSNSGASMQTNIADNLEASQVNAQFAERLTSIDQTLSTAATLASDTESRMVLLEESVAALSQSTAQSDAQSGNESYTRLEEQLSAMQATLDAQAAESAARIEALETQLAAQNTNSQKDFETQLSSIRAQTETLARSIDKSVTKQQDQQNNTEQSITLLDEKIASLTTRINTLGSVSSEGSNDATDSNALASVTAQVDQRLAAIEERIAAATSTDTRTTITALQTKLDDANKRIGELESSMASSIDASVTDLTSSVTDVSGNVANVETEVGTLKGSYSELQTNIQTLQEDLGALKSTVESYAIEDLQNDLQTKLTNLENQVRNSPSNDIASITSAIEQSRNRIKTLEQRVTDLPAKSDESQNAMKAQTALQKQIAALESRLSNASPAADEQLSNTLSSVQKQVNDLKNRKYLTAEDLQRSTSGKSIEYKIYFDKSQIGISEEAAKVLDSFIAQESNRATSISIFGTTDRSGSEEYNQQLAKRRANRVRSYLIQRGYDFSKIGAVDGIGEDLAAAELPDGKEDANQRSVIIYAYQP